MGFFKTYIEKEKAKKALQNDPVYLEKQIKIEKLKTALAVEKGKQEKQGGSKGGFFGALANQGITFKPDTGALFGTPIKAKKRR